jgi:hypothetical protein
MSLLSAGFGNQRETGMKVSNPRAGEAARKEARQAYCPSWAAVRAVA